MNRYNLSRSGRIKKHHGGKYVTYEDANGAVQSTIDSIMPAFEFILAHADDIENDINDFGHLKSVLAMVKESSKTH